MSSSLSVEVSGFICTNEKKGVKVAMITTIGLKRHQSASFICERGPMKPKERVNDIMSVWANNLKRLSDVLTENGVLMLNRSGAQLNS